MRCNHLWLKLLDYVWKTYWRCSGHIAHKRRHCWQSKMREETGPFSRWKQCCEKNSFETHPHPKVRKRQILKHTWGGQIRQRQQRLDVTQGQRKRNHKRHSSLEISISGFFFIVRNQTKHVFSLVVGKVTVTNHKIVFECLSIPWRKIEFEFPTWKFPGAKLHENFYIPSRARNSRLHWKPRK